MPVSLFGFDATSFEYFVQCLCVHAIGPDVVVFGRGRDGGREATFRGKVKPPGRDDIWDGHLIIQAKCKEKTEGTKLDQDWALTQLRAELTTLSKKKGTKKPDYYIFATNVTLTPVETVGGKDKATELIENFPGLTLRGFSVWDQSQIEVFLGAYSELRTRFSSYLTPSDVLSHLLKNLEAHDRRLSEALQSYLQSSLIEDRDARLDQAGTHTDERTSLADVFVDLKVNPKGLVVHWEQDQASWPVLKELMNISSLPLVRQDLNDVDGKPSRGESKLNSRYVLIGGPGSGKSTVGQVLCQIHRAALVQSGFSARTNPEQRSAAAAIRALCERESISWPARPRIPFRIELSAFATALASRQWGSATILADYLAHHTLGEGMGNGHVILDVIRQYPALIVLDGLDEVPASSNRAQVVQAIQRFLTDADVAGCDLLIIGSTRPDGYGGEFGRSDFEYRYVQDLDPPTALRYARLYLERRFGTASRTSELLERLQHALRNELTSKLMRSPLQVTFMATLVAAGGSPPRERWRLFHDYFDTIYKREQQKAREAKTRDVLSKRQLLEAVHHDVGFLLQVRSEHTGGTESMMAMATFQDLVDRHLDRQGWKGTELKGLQGSIRSIATDRLVFLSSRVAGRVSFDIRSLQEYMAAERLMTGPDKSVIDRIRAIAGCPYWRNVLLFAVGQMFGDPRREHLIDSFFGTCTRLNSRASDVVAAEVAYGARLALDTILDGALDAAPAHSDTFIGLALELLKCPMSLQGIRTDYIGRGQHDWERLASVYTERHMENYRARVNESLQAPHLEYRMPAVMLLAALTNRGFRWAEKMLLDAVLRERDSPVPVLFAAGLARISHHG